VLDLGCNTGYLAASLSQRGCDVVGFEIDPAAADEAERHCSRVIVGDLDRQQDRDLIDGRFDVILMGDVLEHLRAPLPVLASVRPLLTRHGIVIASIPNIATWRVRLAIARGRFDYEETGILDHTHLRFFTRRSARELAQQAGYVVEREQFTLPDPPYPAKLERVLPVGVLRSLTNRLAARRPEPFAFQFVLTLRPADAQSE
jgi:2-polyprenyl-3-methyl-5-hydroxy-6-metoxy-1,4-benzoquinol methylase